MRTPIAIVCLAVLMCISALAQSAPPDPCKLLTPADITATLGTGFRKVVTRECSFVRGADTVTVSVRQSPGPVSNVIAPQRDATQGAKPISGACEAGFSRPSGSVLAGKGKWLVLTTATSGTKPNPTSAEKLASLMCSRL